MIYDVKPKKERNSINSSTYCKLKSSAQNHVNKNIHLVLWLDEIQSLLDEGFKVTILKESSKSKQKYECLVSFDSPTPRTLSMKLCKISYINPKFV